MNDYFDREERLILIFNSLSLITFIGLCYLGIKYEWSYWFFKAIGLQIVLWLIFFLLRALGKDGEFFYFSTFFQHLAVILGFTITSAFFIGWKSLLVLVGLTIVIIAKPNPPHTPWDNDDDIS